MAFALVSSLVLSASLHAAAEPVRLQEQGLTGNVRQLMQPGGGDGGDGGMGGDGGPGGMGGEMTAEAPGSEPIRGMTTDVAGSPTAAAPTTTATATTATATGGGMMMGEAEAPVATTPAPADLGDDTCTLSGTEYCSSYSIEDTETGTMMVVTVGATTRDIESNAIPDFETGYDDYLTADEISYSYPVVPVWTGSQITTRQPGISIHGIPFDPAGQDIYCDGEALALEQAINLELGGVDLNGAHVGEGRYHYHGVPTAEINATDTDLVHAGFATDGYMVYYSKTGAYTSSYELISGTRTVFGDCTLGFDETPITLSEEPDGGIEEDWVYTEGAGNLDECNGATVDGEYAYFITDTFPFIPRCLNGEFEDTFEAPDGLGGDAGAPGEATAGAPGEATTLADADSPVDDTTTDGTRAIDTTDAASPVGTEVASEGFTTCFTAAAGAITAAAAFLAL